MYSAGIFNEASGKVIRVWVTDKPHYTIKEPFTEEEFNALEPSSIIEIKGRLKSQLINKLLGVWFDEDVPFNR